VATILSAQCTDVRVNMVTPVLFEKYPTPEHLPRFSRKSSNPTFAPPDSFRNKSKSVVGAARKLNQRIRRPGAAHHGRAPATARSSAQDRERRAGTWYKIADGVVVDTHVQRISRRLELTKNEEPRKIEQDLMKVIPRDKWIILRTRSSCMAGRCASRANPSAPIARWRTSVTPPTRPGARWRFTRRQSRESSCQSPVVSCQRKQSHSPTNN